MPRIQMGSRGSIGEAVEQVGGQLYDTAMRQIEIEREADRVAAAIKEKNLYSDLYGQAVERMKTATVEDLRETDYLEDADSQINERLGGVKDPQLKVVLMREAGTVRNHAMDQHRTILGVRTREDRQATSLKDTQRLVANTIDAVPSADAPSLADAWKKTESEHIRTLRALAATGVWGPEQEYALAKRFYRESAEGLIAKDPKKARAFLAQFKDSIEGDDYRRMENLLDAKMKEQNAFEAYATLHKENEGDPLKMRQALMDPERARQLGLDASGMKAAESLISDLEKNRAAVFEKTETGYVSLAAEGKLRKSAVISDLNKGLLSPAKAQHWIDHLDRVRDEKTDWMAFVKLEDKIMRGEASADDVISKAAGIGMKDRARLLSTFYTRSREINRESEKVAKDYIKSQLVTTGPLGSPLPAEWERVYLAYQALDNYSDEAKKAGKPWTLDQYVAYAKKLANHYRPTMESKVQDQMNAIQAKGQSPGTRGESTLPEVPKGPAKRLKGETIDEYEKRIGGK